MSLTDEMTAEMLKQTSDSAKKALKAGKKAGEFAKGICLILDKGVTFTADNVMQAVKSVAFVSTKDIRFSKRNININEFQKNKDVRMVGEAVTADVMKYFDRHCKKYGVKYSAVYNSKEDNYTIFFEGKKENTIFKVMQEAFKDYTEEIKNKGKNVKKEKEPETRESVKAKLAFFRNWVKNRDGAKEKDGLEKNHHLSDRQR